MGVVDLADVRAGMVLHADVVQSEDRLLIAAGTELTEKHLRMLSMWGVVEVDVVMPEMGGRQFAECLERARPGTPVLFVSGYPDDAFGSAEFAVPGAGLLQKPFTAAELGREVKPLLERG